MEKTPRIWMDQTVVYGPLWPLLCKIFTSISFGNIALALFIFKIVNLLVHMLNCYLIWKISKKKIFVLIYGLNPLVLFEALSNVHNDIFVIMFVLLSLFFLIKKKNIILFIIFIALATVIKYFTILLIPFMLIYYFRNKKPSKRILYSIGLGIIFLLIIGIIYLIYMRDLEIFKGMFTQQEKLAKSIFLVIDQKINNINVHKIANAALIIFSIVYIYIVLVLLFKPKIQFRKCMKIYNALILLFLFFTITNFQCWYIMWLLPTIMWQNKKDIMNIINITIAFEIANIIFFKYNEGFIYGVKYFIFALCLYITLKIINRSLVIYKNRYLTKVSSKNI